MSTVDATQKPESTGVREIPRGLSSLACHAAIELDNLLLGENLSMDSVKSLATRLTTQVSDVTDFTSPKSLHDPKTIVALNRALRDSNLEGGSSELAGLVQQTGQVAERLRKISEDPEAAKKDRENVEQMRDFCLLFSKRTAAARTPRSQRDQRRRRREDK